MDFLRKFLISFVVFVAVCYFGLTWFVDSEVKKEFNETMAGIEGVTLSYDDIGMDIWAQCVQLTDVAVTFPQGQHLTADEVNIIAYDQMHQVPHFMTATAKGVTLEADPVNVGEWSRTMQALDLGTIKGDLTLDYAYDFEDDVLTLKALNLAVPGVGDMAVSGELDSLELEMFRVEKILGLRFRDLRLRFVNGSFMDTLMRESGKWLNMPKEDARNQICGELTAMADYAAKDKNIVAEDALRGLRRYVNDPHTVTITATPPEPVPFLYFFMGRDFYDNLRLMNVKVMTDSSEDI